MCEPCRGAFRTKVSLMCLPGLCADPVKRKGVVADKVRREEPQLLVAASLDQTLRCSVSLQMIEVIFQLAEFALKKCPEQGKIQVLEQHFHVSHTLDIEAAHSF